MLQIRQSQMKLFAKEEVRNFEDWMVGHIDRHFPSLSARLGETLLREVIRTGIARAAAYGIQSRPAVCKYVDLMIVFGRDFDTNPAYPWAARALRDWKSESGKIDALMRAGQRTEAAARRAR